MHMREKEQTPQSAPEEDPAGEAPTVVRPVSNSDLVPTQESSSPQDERFAEFLPGQTLAGRYTVLGALGQGGMGIVLAAYDARLDRRVALKLLRHRAGGPQASTDENSRLVREAQAMARLSHPNVVSVYDSGTLEDGSLFIAMEFVEGQNLRQWQKQSHSWREVLEAYLAAGRGLAAAHAANLIHRDFKPDNVLVAQDGRIRVTDFGLARAAASIEPQPSAPASIDTLPASISSNSWSSALTLPGLLMGTLGYMPPEALQGHPPSVRGDVFSFCAALYEGLYGQLPFRGSNPSELTQAQLRGKVAPPPASSPVPAWVTRTVMRGLSVDPHERPASMDELLAALADDPALRRRALVRNASLGAMVVVLAGLALWGWTRQQAQEPVCGHMERQLAGIWDEPVRAQVKASLLGTGLPYAQETFTRVASALDGYSSTWVQQRGQVCEALQQQPATQGLAVLQEYCLERRRSQLRELTALLAQSADPGLLSKAVQATQALPPLAYCEDIKALMAAVPPPEEPALRAQVEKLNQQADKLYVLYAAARYQEGLALGGQLLGQVEPLGYAPLRARVLFLLAQHKEASGDFPGSEALFRQALLRAAEGRDYPLLSLIWSRLVYVVGYRQARHQEALQLELAAEASSKLADEEARGHFLANVAGVYHLMGKYDEELKRLEEARAIFERAQGIESLATINVYNNLGNTLWSMGRHEEARQYHERVLELRQKVQGPEHPAIAQTLNNLSNVYVAMGRYEQALEQFSRAAALHEKNLGATHLETLMAVSNLGIMLAFVGKPEEGRQRHEHVLAMREKALGPEHPHVAASLNNLGSTLNLLGRYEESMPLQERALAIRRKVLGPKHPDVAQSSWEVGYLLALLGRPAEGRRSAEQGVAIIEKALGPAHPAMTEALRILGVVLTAQGRYEEAQRRLERGLAVIEKALGRDHPDVSLSLLSLGELHLKRGKPAEALPLLERAIAHVYPKDENDVAFALARALWDANKDRPRARSLATQARDSWQQWNNSRKVAEVSQWLQKHEELEGRSRSRGRQERP
jgi:serine/threonine-protein kinase